MRSEDLEERARESGQKSSARRKLCLPEEGNDASDQEEDLLGEEVSDCESKWILEAASTVMLQLFTSPSPNYSGDAGPHDDRAVR